MEGARAHGDVDDAEHVRSPIRPGPKRETAGLLADLMTPVIKAFFTDMGFEAANMAMQCYGGHGYIRDNGVEQFVRDGRINQIYEGANGVQAMDLVGRKLGRKGGAAPMALFGAHLRLDRARSDDDDTGAVHETAEARARYAAAGDDVAGAERHRESQRRRRRRGRIICGMMGIVVVGWMWARMAKVAQAKLAADPDERAFYKDKLVCARYWMERLIPECPMLLERIQAGSATIMEFD